MDGLGMGLGFLAAMVTAGTLREVIGAGTFWGVPLFGSDYQAILMVILAPGGFITIGLLIGLFRTIGEARDRARRANRMHGVEMDAMEVSRV